MSKKGNLSKEDIGRVDVKDHYAFAAVSRSKYKQVLKLVQNEKIKGVKALIELANDNFVSIKPCLDKKFSQNAMTLICSKVIELTSCVNL